MKLLGVPDPFVYRLQANIEGGQITVEYAALAGPNGGLLQFAPQLRCALPCLRYTLNEVRMQRGIFGIGDSRH